MITKPWKPKMPNDDSNDTSPQSAPAPAVASRGNTPGFFRIPPPLKRLFDRFPFITYPANELPTRAPTSIRQENALYIFTTAEGAASGQPSFNPSCLKWQTYLKFCGIDCAMIPSNNHASPSGALPFLLPATSSATADPPSPVPASKIQKWVAEHKRAGEEPGDLRYEAYMSLLDHSIRRAWLYNLYLTPNFGTIILPLYIFPTTTAALVQLALSRELRAAAATELRKHTPVVDVAALYADAEEAFSALETLLGEDEWFFGAEKPGLFDAAVFAYTHLLMDDGLGEGWADGRLRGVVVGREGLGRHRGRVLEGYYQ